MDVFYSYLYGTAGLMALQALPLLASPTIIVTLLSPEARQPTPVEEYFSRALGIAYIALGILSVLLTGAVPLTSSLADTTGESAGTTTDPADPKAPYAVPTLSITMGFHAAMAFFCYARYTTTNSTTFLLGCSGYTVLSAVGLWCLLFASSSGHISRKTGADKRTSGFPFGNKEADKKRRDGKKSL